MRRSHFLPIASVALLVAAACGRSAAQGNAEYSQSTRNPAGRAPAPIRVAAPASVQTSGPTAEGTPGTPRKSWKDLAHGKSDGKSDKHSVTFAPWSAAGALAVVVGVILVLARLFRRHAPMFPQSLPQEALEILGRRFVEPRQTILLVRIGARILVVGSSANGLYPLGQIDDPVEVDLLAGICRRGPHTGILATSFFKLLKGEAGARPDQTAVRSTMSPRQAESRGPIAAPPPASHVLEPPDGLSQPEYDLMRRLRGGSAPLAAERTESAL